MCTRLIHRRMSRNGGCVACIVLRNVCTAGLIWLVYIMNCKSLHAGDQQGQKPTMVTFLTWSEAQITVSTCEDVAPSVSGVLECPALLLMRL